MPTNSELVTMVREHCVDTQAFPRYSDAVILRRMNIAGTEIARKSLCVQKISAIDVVANQIIYDLPSDFLRMKSVFFQSTEINEDYVKNTVNSAGFGGFGGFQGWARWGLKLRLNFVPSSGIVGGLQLFYFASPAALVTVASPAVEIPERYHNSLGYRTASLVLLLDEESSKAAEMNALYEDDIRSIIGEEQKSSQVDPGYVSDTYDPVLGYYR